MNIAELTYTIRTRRFTADEIAQLRDAVNSAAENLSKENAQSFTTGSIAYVEHSKLGGRVQVEVEKVKIKKADVKIVGSERRFRVPLSMLQAA